MGNYTEMHSHVVQKNISAQNSQRCDRIYLVVPAACGASMALRGCFLDNHDELYCNIYKLIL